MTTMQEIARRAGVSRSTVSLVLNGRAQSFRISEYTCERVMKIANEMNYKLENLPIPSPLVRPHVIGLFIPTLTEGLYGTLVERIIDVVQDYNCFVKVVRFVPGEVESITQWRLERVIATRLHGVIILGLAENVVTQIEKELLLHQIPMIPIPVSEVQSINAIEVARKMCRTIITFCLFLIGDIPATLFTEYCV